MKSDNDSALSGHSPKPRQRKTREVSSRFQSPSPTPTTPLESGFVSRTDGLSPLRSKPTSSSADARRQRSLEEPGFTPGQLWPSSSPATAAAAAASAKRNLGTLADYIGNDRLRDKIDEKSVKTASVSSLGKQGSFREFKSLENDRNNNNSSKENDRPIIGGSMRFTGRFGFPGKSSSSSLKKPNSSDSGIVPGRLSVDENALYRKSSHSRRNLDCFTSSLDSESDYSDAPSGAGFSSPAGTLSSRKLGIEVPSKYMSDTGRRARRGTSDSNIPNPLSSDDSSMIKNFIIKKAISRANSLTGYKSSKSQWALSPGRSVSPTIFAESKEKPTSFSSLRPPTSPSKAKGLEKFLSMGFDLFKTKKSSSNSSPMGFGKSEAVHRLRLLDNRLIQWRYANARAQAVNKNISHQAKSNLKYASDGLTKLRHSVLQKKIQFEREKLEMKLNFILHSQMKLLEAWGGMERQHLSAITVTKECLHSVVCRVPLLEGAEVDIQSASIAQRHASDITASIKSVLTSFSPTAEKTAELLSELAEVVAEEKLLLEEFYDLFRTICVLELQERSLKCSLIQFEMLKTEITRAASGSSEG